jgi:hypothetical protein
MEGVADVGSDDEFAITLDDAVPRVTLVILRLLHCRSVDRSLLNSRWGRRNGPHALTAYETNTAGEIKGN